MTSQSGLNCEVVLILMLECMEKYTVQEFPGLGNSVPVTEFVLHKVLCILYIMFSINNIQWMLRSLSCSNTVFTTTCDFTPLKMHVGMHV